MWQWVSQRQTALQLIQRLLAERNNSFAVLSTDIHEVFAAEFDDKFAYRLVALLELNRRLAQPSTERLQIRQPGDAARLMMATMSHLKIEQMRVLVLNSKNDLVLDRMIYQGTVNSSVLRVAEVYRPAIVRNCPAIILCHNHPSGDPAPSPEDIAATELLVQAGKLFDIELVDHLIIGHEKYISLRTKLRW